MANDTVDTRVVRMEFDNKQFEKNVKQTTKSLDNLKESLDFKGVGDGLDKVKVKISALQIATTTFVATLTHKLINLGVTIVKSLSVDNIASGWAKFGEKTISVATMMAQRIRVAGEEITDVGKKTEVVNELLEKLTWFADETSYSLSDMTNYASKFIAAGVDLDKAVNAMEGIATWAALAGQNSQVASRAMMQLAQAMGRNVNRQDWSSIQTANMDTEEFREKVLETAVAFGTLTKEGEKFVTKTGKKFDKAGFLTYLSEGWFTSDVLVETLSKYSAAVDQIYALAEEKGLTASEVIEQYADQLDEFGLKAFKAAQEARTFTDVLNSVKDAVTSKWMITFENIFGNKDEAVKLWTDLANELYDVFAESGNFRNNILSIWKEAGGREDIFGEDGAFWNLYDAIKNIADLIKRAWNTIFPISEMEDEDERAKDIARTLKDITAKIKEFTNKLKTSEETGKKISRVFEMIFNALKVGLFTLRAIHYVLEPVIYALKQLATNILTKIASLTGGITGVLNKIESVAVRIRKTLTDLIEVINPSGVLNKFLGFIQAVFNIIKEFNPLERLVNLFDKLFAAFKEGGGTQDNLIKIFKGLLSIVSIVAKAFIALAQAIAKYVLPILDDIIVLVSQLIGYLTGVVIAIVAAISEIISTINDALSGGAGLSEVGDSFKGFITTLGSAASAIIPILKSLVSIVGSLINLVLVIPKALNAISVALTGHGIIDNLKRFLDSVVKTIDNFANGVSNIGSGSGKAGTLEGIFNALIKFFNGLIELLKGLVAIGQIVINALGVAFKVIGQLLQKLANFFITLFEGDSKELSNAAKSAAKFIAVLAIIAGIIYLLWSALYRIMAALDPLGTAVDSFVDVCDRLRFAMLGNAIKQIGKGFLLFAVAVAILSKVDSSMAKTVILIGAIALTLYTLYKMLGEFTDATISWSETIDDVKEAGKVVKKTKTNLDAFKAVKNMLLALGVVMLEIAATAYIFDKLDPAKNSFGKVLIILGILLTSMLALTIMLNIFGKKLKTNTNKASKATKALKLVIPIMTGILAMVIALAIIAKQMDNVSDEGFKKAMITFGAVAGTVLALVIAIGLFAVLFQKYVNKTANAVKLAQTKAKTTSATFNGLALTLLTMAALVGTISAAVILLTKGAEKSGASGEYFKILIASFAGIAVLLAEIGIIIGAMMKMKPDMKKVGQISILLALFAGLITTIAISLSAMASLPFAKLITASSLMVLLMFEISLIIESLMTMKTNTKKAMSIAILLTTFTGLLLSIGGALALVTFIPFENLIAAMVGIALLLGEIYLLTVAMSSLGLSLKKSIAIGALMSAFSVLIISIGTSLSLMSIMPTQNILAGMVGITLILGVVGALALAMVKLSPTLKKSIGIGALMSAFSVLILSVGASLSLMAGMDWKTIFAAVGAIMLVLVGMTAMATILTKMPNVTGSFVKLTAGLILLSSGLIVFAIALRSLNGVDMAQSARGLKLIGLSLAALIILAALAKNIIPALIGLATAILMISAAVMVLGVGLTLIANAINNLSNNGEVLKAFLTNLAQGIVSMLEIILVGIATIVPKVLVLLIQGLGQVLNAIITLLNTYAGPLAEALLNVVTVTLQKIADHIDAIIAIGNRILYSLINGLLDFVKAYIGPISDKIIDIVIILIDNIASNLPRLLTAIVNLLTSLTKMLGELIPEIIKTLVPAILDALIGIWNAIMEAFGAEGGMITKEKFQEVFGQIFEVIGNVLGMIMDIILNVLNALDWESIFNTISTILTVIGNILTALMPVINAIITAVLELITAIDWQQLLTFVATVLTLIAEIIEWLAPILANVISAVLKVIVSILTVLIKITEPFLKFLMIILEPILNIIIAIIETIAALFEGDTSKLAEIWNKVGESFKKAWDNLVNFFKNLFKTIGDFFTKVIKGVVNFFKNIFANIGNWFKNLFATIGNWFKNLWNNFVNWGRQLIEGLVNGIKSGWENLKKGLQKFGDKFKNFFKNMFGIHSPSRIFADYGKYMIKGLGVGLEEESDREQKTFKKIATDTLRTFEEALFGDEDGYDYVMNIGMDISNVEKQGKKVQDLMSSISSGSTSAAYSTNADNVSRSIAASERANRQAVDKSAQETSTDNSVNTQNNTFNITSTDPKEAADEIDKILKKNAVRAKLAKGNI